MIMWLEYVLLVDDGFFDSSLIVFFIILLGSYILFSFKINYFFSLIFILFLFYIDWC